MNKIKKKCRGILNPLCSYIIDGQEYYPFWYFDKKKYSYNDKSKIVIDGKSYYLKYKTK